MKKKMITMLLATALLVPLFAGCGSGDDAQESKDDNTSETKFEEKQTEEQGKGSEKQEDEPSDEKIELEFWSWWSSEARKPHIDKVVEDYNASQDKYHVTYVDIPWGDIFTKNIAQIAAGNPTDVMANFMEEVRFRAEEGQVESLEGLVTDDVKDGFYEQYLDVCTGTDGQLYALPFSVDTRAIYYNKDHFAEAGIKPEDIKTWDDLMEAAHKLDVKEDGEYTRYGFIPLQGNAGLDTYVINANQGQGWFNEETKEITVNTPTNVAVLEWIREQIEYYGQDNYNEIDAAFNSGMTDPFASGAISMLAHTSAYTSALANTAPDLNYGVMLFPEYKEGNGHAVNGGGFVLEAPKGAKHLEGSYDFMKFMTSRETQDYIAVNIGDFSARNDFDESDTFFQNEINRDLAEALEETFTVVVPNEFKGYQDVVNSILDQGKLGLIEPAQAMEEAQVAFEQFAEDNQ